MDAPILEELEALGLNAENYRALVLLPLIQVAWSDGKIQGPEKELILEVAEEGGLIDGTSRSVVEKWLEDRPTSTAMVRGAHVLVALARLSEDDSSASTVTVNTLSDILEFSHQVAEAAGGMFGLAESISRSELHALEQIGRALQVHTGNTWLDILDY